MVMEELWVVCCGNPSSVALILPCIYVLFNNNVVNLQNVDIDNLLCSNSILGQSYRFSCVSSFVVFYVLTDNLQN